MEKTETKGLSWAAALLITAFLIGVSLLAARLITAPEDNSLGSATLLPCNSSQQIVPLGDGVLYSDGTHLHALNARGRQIWNYMVGVGFGFEASAEGVAAWTGSSVSLLDAQSGASLFSGVMDEPVISAVMGQSYAGVLIGQDEQNSTLVIMEHGGREIDRIELSNLTVLQYGFFNNGNMLWVMSLDTEGTVPMSQLTTYRPGRMQSGNITDSEQVIYQAMFESPNVYTIGTTYARVYDYTGVEDPTRRILVYGWYLMDSGGSGGNAMLAFAPMAQVGNEVSISDVRLLCGSVDRTVHMPFPCYDLMVYRNRVYGFARQYVMAYGLTDSQATTWQLPMECDSLLGITDAGSAVLVSGGSVYLVPLP